MTKTYNLQPGTFPARVVAHLQALPPGTELSSAVLADELGQPLGANIASLLDYARQRGALKARKDGRILFWSLGDGTPAEQQRDQETAQDRIEDSIHAVKRPPPPVLPVLSPRPVEATEPPAAPVPAPAPADATPVKPPKPSRREFRAGLFTDGTLLIEAHGFPAVRLERNEADQLADLLAGGRP